ncbi:MAG: hypothetical protein AAFR88_08025 [Pseudomonadota bacterium]
MDIKGLAQQALRSSNEPAPLRYKRRSKARSVARHPIFVPALAGWGAALGGLSVLALPSAMISPITMIAGLGALGDPARFVIAAVAAISCGLAALCVAMFVRSSLAPSENKTVSYVRSAMKVNPIDPASELGSQSLDEPITDMPYTGSQQEPEASPSEEPLDLNQEHEIGESEEHELAEQPAKRRHPMASLRNRMAGAMDTLEQESAALDLGAYGEPITDAPLDQISERDEVWVIGSEAEVAVSPGEAANVVAPGLQDIPSATSPDNDTACDPIADEEDSGSAIERLRQTPTEDLSLVQMVERFAAALHDHQEAARRQAAAGFAPPPGPGRDAALAEALKALSLFTERGFASSDAGSVPAQPATMISDTERELRHALNRLQDLRGAA